MRRVAVSVAAVLALASCQKSAKPPVVGEPSLADSAEQVIYAGHSLLTNEGVKRGEMFADTIFVFNDQTRFALRRVRATFNTETGAPNGTLKGDRGTYDLRAQMLEGFGNVVLTSTDGRQLTSNHLRYMQGTNLVSTDSAYTLVRGNDVSRGIGFTSDPNLNSFKCFRACSGSALLPIQTLPSR